MVDDLGEMLTFFGFLVSAESFLEHHFNNIPSPFTLILTSTKSLAPSCFFLGHHFDRVTSAFALTFTAPKKMPRAEAGTTKAIANQLKSKGLQRLRWWCEVCQKQCRDGNGFKMHTQSEGHVRNLLVVGENAKKHIDDYSSQFKSNFLHLLKTAHGTKQVHANHFYQEYISDKQHVHMNATRWRSLMEFIKFLGREGLCRVEEGDRGLEVAWIDNSPEALRRAEAIRKRERMEKGDEEREQRLIKEQIRRAQQDAEEREDEEIDEEAKELQREEGKKITLTFGSKPAAAKTEDQPAPNPVEEDDSKATAGIYTESNDQALDDSNDQTTNSEPTSEWRSEPKPESKISLSLGGAGKPKNVFATTSKKNALGGSKTFKPAVQRPMSEAERIMKEELERKRKRDAIGFNNGPKRQKT